MLIHSPDAPGFTVAPSAKLELETEFVKKSFIS